MSEAFKDTTMPLLTPTGKQYSLHKLVAMSTLMSPTHTAHFRPLIQAGGGDATSEIPSHHLYLSHGVQEHLLRVYDGLRGADATLSKAKFESWLATVQEQSIVNLDAEEYKFEQFLEAVYYNRGFEAIREVKPEEKDLTKPLSNYYVSSSHNTYLSGNQLMSKSTTDAYTNVSSNPPIFRASANQIGSYPWMPLHRDRRPQWRSTRQQIEREPLPNILPNSPIPKERAQTTYFWKHIIKSSGSCL